jgi:pyruvate/2-oxoglutarate dehydrogenase complex dihydrolipoamide acyltransferase (E2) component
MIDIVVPIDAEGTQATVRSWLKRVGDPVVEHEPLVELETDKVAMEVPAPASGVLREILIDVDAEASPGALLGRMALESEATAPEEGPAGEVIEHTNAPAKSEAVFAKCASPLPSSAPAYSTISIRAGSRVPAETAASPALTWTRSSHQAGSNCLRKPRPRPASPRPRSRTTACG